MAEPTQFDLASAARVARVVRTVEDTGPRARPLTFERVDAPQKKVIRTARYTGTWDIGQQKTVTFRNQTTTPNTVSAINLTFALMPFGNATEFDCIIAKEGTAWYLAEAEEQHTRIGYFTGDWSKGNTKTVTFYQSATPKTVTAANWTLDISAFGSGAARDCYVTYQNGYWYLIEAEEDTIRRGTFTAPWTKNTQKTISLAGGLSVTADNRHGDVPGTGTKNCTIARDGTAWEVIAAECS